jgi:hypothetical protein
LEAFKRARQQHGLAAARVLIWDEGSPSGEMPDRSLYAGVHLVRSPWRHTAISGPISSVEIVEGLGIPEARFRRGFEAWCREGGRTPNGQSPADFEHTRGF